MIWTPEVRKAVWVGLGTGLVLGLLIVRSQFRLAVVVGESMRPGLQTGDLLLVDRNAFRAANPERGQVVLARAGRELLVKRVVGLPGEEVSVARGHVYVNGVGLEEGQPIQAGPLSIAAGRLFQGRYALLGDNRNAGVFQVAHAVVEKEQIVGRIVWVLRWRPILAGGAGFFGG